jgi:uncharacterized protein (TIGR02145 family)
MPSSSNKTFTDARDGKAYKHIKIGTQIWMAENLNYNAAGSKCYDNKESYCDTYGRLYDWATAMALPSSCNSNSSFCPSQINANHRGICPSGWHIPSNVDWDKLLRYVDVTCYVSWTDICLTAGQYLKSASGWNWNDYEGISGNGTDEFGFAALPGGLGNSSGSFSYVGESGYWWSASEGYDGGGYGAYKRFMDYALASVLKNNNVKSYLFSVRCVQN